MSDFATGLSTCVLKDGTQTITSNIPFSSNKITGLAAGTALTDASNVSNVQSGIGSFLTSVSGTNTITATATPTPGYAVGQRFTFVPANTNTGATTLNISSVGAGAVQLAGAALTGGELVASVPVTVYVSAATPVFEIITPTQFPDSRALVVGATDSTKKVRFEVDGLTTATTRVVTIPDRNLTLGGVLGTPVASTSGTSITFTGIPADAREVTVHFVGVSTNGTQNWQIQIGPSGGVETSGYNSGCNASGTSARATTGFIINNFGSAAVVLHGDFTLKMEDSSDNTWTATGILTRSDADGLVFSCGAKACASAIDRLRITMDGTDTFDAGEINISYRA